MKSTYSRHRFVARFRHAALLSVTLLAALFVAAPAWSQAQRKACIDCHQDFKPRLKAKFVHSPVKKACEECHLRHGFTQKLVLKKDLPALCIDCHANVGTEMASPNVHKALNEGGCYVCHDSHSADNAHLLRTMEKGKSVCLVCHEDLGPTMADKNAHDPFKKGDCTACHRPHASDRPNLAVAAEADMCAPCHKNVMDKHRKVTGAADQNCTSCHDPHVASDKMKLAANAHPPFAEGDCASCHDVENGEVEIGDDFPARDMCATCHEDVAARVAGAESHFGADPMKSGGTETCLKCHGPHHSGEKGLLVKAQDELCRSCHESLAKKSDFETSDPKAPAKGGIHPPFADGKCTTCHDPHGGGGEHHLAQASSTSLCGSCHQAIVAEAKPGEVHHEAMDGAECLDCHGGHASTHGALLSKPEGEICADCHEKQKFAVGHPPYAMGTCGGCHNNHSRKPKLFAKDAKSVCGTCHPEQLSLSGGARFTHPPTKDEDCLSCHAGHGSAHEGILNTSQKELCASCHDTAELAKKTAREANEPAKLHAPVMEGNCSGCHDAHGSNITGLVARERADLCYGCHTQQKLSFVEGLPHDPVLKGSCDVCHTPHGSTAGALRTKSEPELCTQCHDLTKPPLDGAHKGYNVATSQCTSCHTPHTSKQQNLLNPVVHSPFAEGDCESCHEGGKDASGKMSAVAADACMTCHDDMATKKGHQHAKDVTCVSCHQPHSSKGAHLINDAGRLCQGCHQDVVQAGAAEGSIHRHSPVEQGRCLDCHKMHEPVAEKHLAKDSKQLCASCHADMAARSSDKTQHDPFRKGNCGSCHEVHVSESANLLKKGEGGLCKSCHGLTTPKMSAAHKVVPLTGSDTCSSCHDPHSTKQAASKLVYPVKHAPFKDKDCTACHAADGKAAATVAACGECHDQKDGYSNAHNAGRKGDAASSISVCSDCHSPHAGFGKLLVRASQNETCMQCHDRREFTRKTVHAALDEGCTACHDVHDRGGLALRGAAVNETCGGCHDATKTHAHVVGGPAKDPRTGDLLSCVSCHEAHSSNHEHMMKFDEKRDLCVQCHSPDMSN